MVSSPETNTGKFNKPPLKTRSIPSSNASLGPGDRQVPEILKRLVWCYFWFLLLEGAIRKWALPQYSAPLLIIRDPIVLLIYGLAYNHNLFPQNKLASTVLFTAGAGVALLVIQLLVLDVPLFVLAYGYRTAFLHFPLILLLPEILNQRDLVRVGKWILICAIPMAVLMGYQFQSPAEAWVNRTVGLTGGFQLPSVGGKIRPPGTFSFISGPVAFFSLVTAVLGYGLVSRQRPYPGILLTSALVSVGLAVAVSGSRATILSGVIVVFTWVFGLVAGQRVGRALTSSLAVVLAAVFILGNLELVREGAEVLTERMELAADAESGRMGIFKRFLQQLINPLMMWGDLPVFGMGLGLGTNAGAALLTGRAQFLISEGEWGRNLLEMGPVLGLLYIGFRLYLTYWLGAQSMRAAQAGHIFPLLLFSACAVNLFAGQIAQPTTLGFTVLVAGMCFAALKRAQHEPRSDDPLAPPLTAISSRGQADR